MLRPTVGRRGTTRGTEAGRTSVTNRYLNLKIGFGILVEFVEVFHLRALAFSISITFLAGGGLWISSLPDPSVTSPVNARLANLPVQFVPNEGQVDARVAYYVKGRTTAVFFTRDGVYYSSRGESGKPELTRPAAHREEATPAAWNVKLEFLDPNPNVRLRAGIPSGAVVSYFRGPRENWPAGLTAYSTVIYEESGVFTSLR